MVTPDLSKLAEGLIACAEDAKRPIAVPGYPDVYQNQPASIISLANAVILIADALKAHLQSRDST